MRLQRRIALSALVAVGCGLTPLLAHADGTQLTWAKSSIAFDGGPLVGEHADGHCLPTSCAAISVTVGGDVAGGWASAPGGIVADIQWDNPNVEIDLFAYDAQLNLLDSAALGGVRSQRVFIANPPSGSYQIWAQAFSGEATTFTGAVSLQHDPTTHPTVASSTMRFSPPALVDPQITTGEPGIRMGAGSQSLIDAPWHESTTSSLLWQSQPGEGNLTYKALQATLASGVNDPRRRSCSETVGGSDSDVTSLADGESLFADLNDASVSVSRSDNNGATWTCSTVAASTPDADRPWLVAAPTADGTHPGVDAYLVYRAFSISGQFGTGVTGVSPMIQVDATRDDGQTWSAATNAGDTPDARQRVAGAPVLVKDPGGPFADGSGNVYVPFGGPDGRIYVRHAGPGGEWTTALVAARAGSADYGFVSGATDADGTAYIAWVDQGTFAVDYSTSRDHGVTWSTPVQVSAPGTVNVMPWLAAGQAGDVAIAWYGAVGSVRPDLLGPTTEWRPMVARTLDASNATPTFEVDEMTTRPVHEGALCVPDLPGGVCGTKQFGDFFTIAIAPTGQLRASFDADAGAAAPFIETVVQVGGMGLSSRAPTALSESRGDATSAGADAPSFDLAALPTASGRSVSMQLADTTHLANADEASLGGAGTQATWLLTWFGPDGRVRYAGLRADKANGLVFFGGASVTNTAVGVDSNYASYPDATPSGASPVTGTISSTTGTVTLTIPTWLRGDGNLRSLQAWTMVGVPQASEPVPLTVVDSTAAYDAVLS